LIFVFNDSDGTLAATIGLGVDDAIQSEGTAAVSGHYLFWGNKQGGLSRLDCGTVDFTADADEIQAITPDLVWNRDWRPKITTNILSEDGKIYFLAGVDSNYEYASILVALDAETNEVIWERNMPLFAGRNPFSLVLNGGNLHVIDERNFCCDKNTGDMIYIRAVTREIRRVSEIESYNNFFYYAVSYYQNVYSSEINALNADTGEIDRWRVFIGDSSTPRFYGERMYVLHETGLRVYNTSVDDSTNFIGVDKSFTGRSRSYTAVYKNMFIFTSNGFLTAIKCE
jgi:outer membrane protein assembly factor BamB